MGKLIPGKVTLSTRLHENQFVVEVGDDGRRIDCAVREKAISKELPRGTSRDLENVLLSERVSPRGSVSEVSGRSVRLAAVSSVVKSLRGRIEIESSPGKGSTWRFRLPGGRLVENDNAQAGTQQSGAHFQKPAKISIG